MSIGAGLHALFVIILGRSNAGRNGRKSARNAKAVMFVAQRKSVILETLKNVGGPYENLYAGR
jgi:hypothetical protein